ncbi:hypothetical protein CDD83_2559 [Cordyceps sp. RAO-2017]|nr:hypothetical protein CDD83_2559 [Cordyceps sp. RAO-2017]
MRKMTLVQRSLHPLLGRAAALLLPPRPVEYRPTAVLLRAAAASPAPASVLERHRRWNSTGGGDRRAAEPEPGSRIWNFEDVKTQLESSKRPGASRKSGVVIIDVREPPEMLATGKIPGSVSMPMTSLAEGLRAPDHEFEHRYGFERPPRDAHLLFYCRAGVRARSAAALARRAGWESVGEYTGSWMDWEKHRGPVEDVAEGRKQEEHLGW